MHRFFYDHDGVDCWTRFPEPEALEDIRDPLVRASRAACLNTTLRHRQLGRLAVPKKDLQEPARTERLLYLAFTFQHPLDWCTGLRDDEKRTGDEAAVLRHTLLADAECSTRLRACHLALQVLMQVIIALVIGSMYGAPSALSRSVADPGASSLDGPIVQLSLVLVCLLVNFGASRWMANDLLVSIAEGMSYLFEAAATFCLLMLVVGKESSDDGVVNLPYVLLVLALFVPAPLALYDASIRKRTRVEPEDGLEMAGEQPPHPPPSPPGPSTPVAPRGASAAAWALDEAPMVQAFARSADDVEVSNC